MPQPQVTVGIFGGMGPLTGYDFFKLVTEKIENELKPNSDQGHPRILFWSDPSIPRRDYCVRILEEKGVIAPEQDARPGLQKGMQLFKQQGASFVVVPCNTFHYFREKLQAEFNLKILDMIFIVADSIQVRAKTKGIPITKVGLLATGSTIKYSIYDKEFNKRQIEVIKPTEAEQENVQEVIELVKQGKAREDRTKNMLIKVIQSLESKGIDFIILGCTELPLVINPNNYKGNAELISSTDELAKATVREISRRLLLNNTPSLLNYNNFFASTSASDTKFELHSLALNTPTKLTDKTQIRAKL
jgi:aspartate racemase